jgi:hypothetical protein
MSHARVTKLIAVAILAVSWAVAAGGCVTVGYDFLKQQATVTFDAKTVKEPTK